MELVNMLTALWPIIQLNGTGIATIIMLCGIGELVKTAAPGPERSRGWRFFWRVKVAHPIAAGVLLGLFFPQLTPEWFAGIAGRPAGVLYFGAAGCLSIVAYDLVHTWRKG
jgi:hypothetical protein